MTLRNFILFNPNSPPQRIIETVKRHNVARNMTNKDGSSGYYYNLGTVGVKVFKRYQKPLHKAIEQAYMEFKTLVHLQYSRRTPMPYAIRTLKNRAGHNTVAIFMQHIRGRHPDYCELDKPVFERALTQWEEENEVMWSDVHFENVLYERAKGRLRKIWFIDLDPEYLIFGDPEVKADIYNICI